MKICVYGAASSLIDENFIKNGEELGRKMAHRGHKLVFGGGRNGMMGAPARGVREKGGEVIGIAPKFFEENNSEVSFENCTEFIYTETMRERKRLLDELSDAFIVAPGGIGTFDEFFEILTLKQLGRHNKAIVILNINGYFNDMLNMMKHAIAKEFIEYISTPNSVKRNMDYIGYVSCIAGEEIFSYVCDNYGDDNGAYEVDLTYFFGEGNYVVKTNTIGRQFSAQYPSKETIDRCVIMNYFSDDANEKITTMWAQISVAG